MPPTAPRPRGPWGRGEPGAVGAEPSGRAGLGMRGLWGARAGSALPGEPRASLQIGSQVVFEARAGRFGKFRFSVGDKGGGREGFGAEGDYVDKGEGRRGGLRGHWATLAQGCEADLGCPTP